MIRCHDCGENPATKLVDLHTPGFHYRGALCEDCTEKLEHVLLEARTRPPPFRQELIQAIPWILTAIAITLFLLRGDR